MTAQTVRNERGVALLLTLLLSFALTGLAMGVVLMTSNTTLISRFHATEAMMQGAAVAGLEQGRDTLNGNSGLLPVTGFDTLELNAAVRDASGNVVPGFTRSTYAGLSGNITGQYGVFASVISVISNTRGAVVVRRAELSQESFAKFARFDDRTTSSIRFANGIQVFGPLHTNQTLYVGPNTTTMPTFWGPVTTASTISTTANGNFMQGYQTNVATIPMPTPAALATLSTYATTGNTVVTGGPTGTSIYNPGVRIEFVPVDINLDGDFSDENEGFFRVFQTASGTTAQRNYVTARLWNTMPNGTPASMPSPPSGTSASTDPNLISPNCGGTWSGDWWTADSIYAKQSGSATTKRDAVRTALNSAARRCFLGGDRRLYPDSAFRATNAYGRWVQWPGWAGVAPAAVQNGRFPAGFGGGTVGAEALYLWPINRTYNVNFKGVIYVNGSAGISGLLRGRVTVAATGNIMFSDDLTYVTSPGSSPDCSADIFGALTPEFFMLDDNNVNAPFEVNNTYRTGYDETGDENLHAAVLTLNSVQSENVSGGSTNSEVCVGNPIGRGCFNMVGSAIQGINGSRMSSSGTGWNPQWTYDRCMGIAPPPYFPTTGRYFKNRYYEVDPVGFSVAAWFAANQ